MDDPARLAVLAASAKASTLGAVDGDRVRTVGAALDADAAGLDTGLDRLGELDPQRRPVGLRPGQTGGQIRAPLFEVRVAVVACVEPVVYGFQIGGDRRDLLLRGLLVGRDLMQLARHRAHLLVVTEWEIDRNDAR